MSKDQTTRKEKDGMERMVSEIEVQLMEIAFMVSQTTGQETVESVVDTYAALKAAILKVSPEA